MINAIAALPEPFKLRDYQERAIEGVRKEWLDGKRSVVVVLSTGSGKTGMTAWMIARASEKGKQCLFVVHRKELLEQTSKEFGRQGVKHGLVEAGKGDWYHDQVNVSMVATLAGKIRKGKRVPKADLVVFDEAHYARAATWGTITEHYKKARFLGLTATPQRLDGKGLGNIFESIVEGPSMAELIGRGYLADFRYFSCDDGIDTSKMRTSMGDYHKEDVKKAMGGAKIVGNAVKEYLEKAPGKQAIVFSDCIENSIKVKDAFCEKGIAAVHLDGKTDKKLRSLFLEQFRQKIITVLCNVNLFTEGLDVPSAEVCILLRPTKSLTMYLQQVGRVLRPFEGKENAIILDHVMNWDRHKMPDEKRKWSLEDRPKKKMEPITEKKCPHCQRIVEIVAIVDNKCPYCGKEFPRMVKSGPVMVDGKLVEIEREVYLTEKMPPEEVLKAIAEEKAKLAEYRSDYWFIDKEVYKEFKNERFKAKHRGLVEAIKKSTKQIKKLELMYKRSLEWERINEAKKKEFDDLPFTKKCEMVQGCKSLKEAIALAKRMGYRSGFAWMQWNNKKMKINKKKF